MLRTVTDSETRTLGYGVAGSLAVHALLFVSLALWMSSEPVRKLMQAEPEAVVTMLFAENVVPAEPAPEPEPPAKQPDSQQFIRTSQNTESATTPANAAFISDRNTVASAKSAPSPDATAPMPTTTGVNLPTMDLVNRTYKDGELKNDSAPSPPPAPPAPPPEKQAVAKAEESPPEKPSNDPDKSPPIEVSKPGSVADTSPMLKVPEEEEVRPKAIPVAQPPAAPLVNAPRPEKNAYQPETRTAEMRGSISDRGAEDAVNAAMTIEGKYMAEIQKAVGAKWHRLAGPRRDLAKPGVFAVHFFVSPDGSVKPDDITVLSEKDNVVLESVAVKAILSAKIPPVPRELRANLDKGRFSAGINFLIGL
jgi:outer membrane biosynthesis protein TonB